jgi:hypothetical protein
MIQPSKKLILPSLLLATSLALAGCEGGGIAAPEKLAKVSVEEAEHYAEGLVEALQTCSLGSLRRVFNIDAATRRGFRASSLSKPVQEKWLETARREQNVVLSELFECDGRDEATHVRLVALREVEGTTRVLVRMERESSYTYWDFFVGKDQLGVVISDDVIDLWDGLSFSQRQTIRANCIASDAMRAKEVVAATDLLSAEPVKGLEAMQDLPESTRSHQWFRLLEYAVASWEPSMDFVTIRDAYRRDFPSHPPTPFIEIEAGFKLKDFDAVLATIESMEPVLRADPGVVALKLSALEQKGDDKRAMSVLKASLEQHPQEYALWQWALHLSLKTDDHPATLHALQNLGTGFSWVMEDQALAEDSDFDKFIKSSEYLEYQTWRDLNFEEAPVAEEDP